MIRRKYAAGAAVAVLMAVAFLLRMVYEGLDNAMLQAVMLTARNTIHISLLFGWVVSLQRRLVNRNVRRLMLLVGALLLFWLTDKIVKWDFTGSETHPLVRYLWYGFYVGMLYVPTLGAFIISYLGKPEQYKHPKKLNYLLIPPTLMLIAVFTNDLHQRVFVFYNGMINFDQEYSYGWIYPIVMGWFIVMGFYFVVMLLVKSRVPGSRKLKKMPLMIMGFGALFWIGYSLRLYNCDLTVMDCLIITLLLESAIQGGLLPSNTRYQEVFDRTTVPVLIVDNGFQPHYMSGGTERIPEELMRRTVAGTVDMGDALLGSAPIRAGRVVWQDDISRLNELRSKLKDTQELLGEENVLLQAEVELKESRAKADEQNRLYDRIAYGVESQLIRVDALLSEVEARPENTRALLAKVCVLGSYIKRRGNLLLLAENGGAVDVRELEYCLRESLDNLNVAGVCASFDSRCEGEAPAEHVVAAYDFFEELTEAFMEDMTAMMVSLDCREGVIRMKAQLGCAGDADPDRLEKIRPRLGLYSAEAEDADVFARLVIAAEGGEA